MPPSPNISSGVKSCRPRYRPCTSIPSTGRPIAPAQSETPWGYREANWAGVIVGVDPDPAKKDQLRDWAVGYHEALHPHSAGGAYINFMMEEGQERVQASYRHNYARLTEVKAKYDPANLFKVNQNIKAKA